MLYMLAASAKTMRQTAPRTTGDHCQALSNKTIRLIACLQALHLEDIARVMQISPLLAQKCYALYQQLSSCMEQATCKGAALDMFQGAVYASIHAEDWIHVDRLYAQKTLGILSGLYGLVAPLDVIQPYRLEMGCTLPNISSKNMARYWRDDITMYLTRHVQSFSISHILDLASIEYMEAVDVKALPVPIVKMHFQERRGNQYKTIGTYAKKARGAFIRFVIKNQVNTLQGLTCFDALGYQWNRRLSSRAAFTFTRDI